MKRWEGPPLHQSSTKKLPPPQAYLQANLFSTEVLSFHMKLTCFKLTKIPNQHNFLESSLSLLLQPLCLSLSGVDTLHGSGTRHTQTEFLESLPILSENPRLDSTPSAVGPACHCSLITTVGSTFVTGHILLQGQSCCILI